MSQQVELNGSCDEVTNPFPQPPIEYSSQIGMLEVGEGPPAPPWLQTIVASLDAKELQNKKDETFVALLFILVHEVGFTVRGLPFNNPGSSFNVNILRNLVNLDAVDRNEFSYHVALTLHDCDTPCDLIIVPHGSIFIVNFHIPNLETYSISYNIDQYIAFNPDNSPRFMNLCQLSKSFKEICNKFRNTVLDHANLPSLHISKMPYEILLKISTYLDYQSFVNFSITCKQFNDSLNQDEYIWKRLYKIHYKTDSVPSNSCTWKKHFIDETKNKLFTRRMHRCETMHHVLPTLTPHLYYLRPLGFSNIR